MKALSMALALCVGISVLSGPLAAQNGNVEWLTEMRERPAEEGGTIRYAIMNNPDGSVLQLGCTPNRIERVLIGLPLSGGTAPLLPPSPAVQYSFDNDDFEAADWPLFEAGTVEVPRGAKSNSITRRVMSSLRFHVRGQATNGTWHEADFNVAGGHQILQDMLTACGIR